MNLLPRRLPRPAGPLLGVSLVGLPRGSWEERAAWAQAEGFDAVELSATGEPRSLHAPLVATEDRAYLRDCLREFAGISVTAPYQGTFDVTIVSPSAAIRRASVSEIWSVCRFAGAIGGGIVVVRVGTPPLGISEERQRGFLSETLTTLDRMAGDHNAVIGLTDHDYFRDWQNFTALQSLHLEHTAFVLENSSDAPNLRPLLQIHGGETVQVHVPVSPPGLGKNDDLETLATLAADGLFTGIACLTAEPNEDAENALRAARDRWHQVVNNTAP